MDRSEKRVLLSLADGCVNTRITARRAVVVLNGSVSGGRGGTGGGGGIHSDQPEVPVHYQGVLNGLAALGLQDCIIANEPGATNPMPGCCCGMGEGCLNVQTYRHNRNPESRPFQNDYLFASAGLVPMLRSWRAHGTEDAWSASDHCPVIATFELNQDDNSA